LPEALMACIDRSESDEMPRARFTLRGMMVAVAIVAVIFGGEVMRRRRADYLVRAEEGATLERTYRTGAEGFEQLASENDIAIAQHQRAAEVLRQRAASKPTDPAQVESDRESEEDLAILNQESARDRRLLANQMRAQAAYFGDLRRKYEDAVRRPWWGVPPDPTEPDWDAMMPATFRSKSLPPIPDAPPGIAPGLVPDHEIQPR
jgi:hypothetical protein